MHGVRVVVPPPGQATMLQLLHSSHNGVVKIKHWHAFIPGGQVLTNILKTSPNNASSARKMREIRLENHFDLGYFHRSLGQGFIGTIWVQLRTR